MIDTNDNIPATATKIEISLSRLSQLFNSLDPSPFHERDLDHDAEDYIVGSAEEAPRQQPLALVIHLPADQLPTQGLPDLREAIHNYFAYRRDQEHVDHRLGGDVAPLGDFSLRVGADPPPMPNTCEACRNASDCTVEARGLTTSAPLGRANEVIE